MRLRPCLTNRLFGGVFPQALWAGARRLRGIVPNGTFEVLFRLRQFRSSRQEDPHVYDPRNELDREIERVEDELMSAEGAQYDELQEELERLREERAAAEERASRLAERRDTDAYPPENMPDA
ncbi:MAG: hypothetical protein D6725_14850 [Planctomycetota bacterium]|nr:MAG: hypothetical protein D6725_14850 [Planctomycetota bacterium]